MSSFEAVFVEDCEFVKCRHAVIANQGVHYLCLYNLIIQGVRSDPTDVHGVEPDSSEGTRCVEIYNNVIEKSTDFFNTADVIIHGGGGAIFDNTTRGYDKSIVLCVEEG